MEETQIAIFKSKSIRKVIHNNEWWFSVVDVCEALTESVDAGAYWRKLKERLKNEGNQVVTFCHGLKLAALDGKKYETDCANTEGVFRIIQSIPSPKAEPFKLWLAKVGYERVQEIDDPELATKRTRILYKAKGYPDSWIEKRMRGIAIREELTNEWKDRGAREKRDYEILTSEISKAAFGVTPGEYKNLKGLKRQNLRDHMDDLELIFTMLGERATTTKLTMYINGISDNEVTASGSATDTNGEFYLGGDVSGEYYNGIVDEAAIFNRALTAAEVLSLYQDPAGSYSFFM